MALLHVTDEQINDPVLRFIIERAFGRVKFISGLIDERARLMHKIRFLDPVVGKDDPAHVAIIDSDSGKPFVLVNILGIGVPNIPVPNFTKLPPTLN